MSNASVKSQKHADQHRREKVLANKSIVPLMLSFSIPTILAMLGQAFYTVVDRIWIGRMENSKDAMAGVGLTMPIASIAFAFIVLVGIGSTALISIRLGQKEYKQAEDVLGSCLTVSTIVGFVVMIVGLLTVDKILPMFGTDADTLPHALAYARVILLFNLVNSVQFGMSSTMRGVGHPTWAVMTQVIGAVTNMILDPIFIFDNYTFNLGSFSWTMDFGLGLGVQGAALATGVAQCVSLLMVVVYFVAGKSPVSLKIASLKPHFKILKTVIAIGMSSFAVQMLGSLVQIVGNRQLVALGGNLAVSAMTIIQSVLMFTIMPVIGVAQGAQPIIGYNYGAGNYARVRKAYFAAVGLASVISVSIAIFVALKTPLVASFFSNDAEQIALATVGMRKSFLLLPAAGFVVISSHYYQNIGRSFVSLTLTVLRQALFLIPLYFILSHFWGLDGFFYSMPVSDALSLVLAVILITIELRSLRRKSEEKNLSTASPNTDQYSAQSEG